MAGYSPLKIAGFQTGLVQEREEFILPHDAYPVLENAYVWREKLKRKQGCQTLGRLQRVFTTSSIGNTGASPWTFNIYSTLVPPIVPETNAVINPGSVVIVIGGAITFTDQGNGKLTSITLGNSGVINYLTGNVTLTHTAGAGVATTITFGYFPSLPVMGLRIREQNQDTFDATIAFDTVYAYSFNGTNWVEFLPGTTWTGSNAEFFWTTNYFIDNSNNKIFWATNYSTSQDPIRYANGLPATNWINFTPTIDASGNILWQALALLPFRGRLVAFNTSEGMIKPGLRFTNRIRWAAIGTPFTVVSALITTVNPNAWRDDIRGQGGFLDIPTSEDIVSVGFVRDNLVIYCERSTWQLRYTGRSIAPFQIEKVNSELGAEGTFSTVQFDTSLVGVGDKGIVECDSYKSERIDIKIPDLVFNFQNANSGPQRVHGIRDFKRKLAFWIYPSAAVNGTFPDKRLLYNYENDSWAIFDDSLTVLGTIQVPTGRTWINQDKLAWIDCNFSWIDQPVDEIEIIGGNQQGFVVYLDEQAENDPTLEITAITPMTTTPTIITSPAHNLQTGAVIIISGIPPTTPYASLNNGIFAVIINDANTFQLMIYNPSTDQFSTPRLDVPSGTYIGGGVITIRDNFFIQSKKFNFMDEGQSIQLGYFDILMDATESDDPGAISVNVYADYNTSEATNTLPLNEINNVPPTGQPDTFFNSVIPTVASNFNQVGGTKFWQRVFCPTRANFITIEYQFNNAQMAGTQQANDVQIDAQILWMRKGGRLTQL